MKIFLVLSDSWAFVKQEKQKQVIKLNNIPFIVLKF